MDNRILYDPYPHQQAIHNSKARRKYDMKPVRSGKDIVMVNENTKDVIEKMPMWSARPETMKPKWNVWWVGETYKLLEQLYRDVLAFTPRELIVGNPSPKLSKQSPEIRLINDCVFSFRSALNEAYLVAEGIDRLNITEAGELPRTAWELLQSRLSSPDRFGTASLHANGTPRGQVDPLDPTKDHWFWAEIEAASGGSGDSESWYWFRDRKNYDGLEHPILSLTPEGRAELDRKRNDPNFSERKFREDYLGECLPVVIGDPAVERFDRDFHVRDFDFIPRYELHRTWDFGRNYPAVVFHQITKDNLWLVPHSIVGIESDLLDEELADKVIDVTSRLFRNPDGSQLSKEQIKDDGDFEATHKQDSRRETTVEVLKSKGIDLNVTPTLHGDEEVAINHLNGRMKIRHDGKPNILIHPRNELLIKCFEGAWVYETATVKGYEYRKDKIAEIHPWIDIFDAMKYFIVRVLVPGEMEQMRYHEREKSPNRILVTDPDTGAPLRWVEA
jgi:hypothetical protein